MMLYKNTKRSFRDPYLGRVVEYGEELELERELKGIELRYLEQIEKPTEEDNNGSGYME